MDLNKEQLEDLKVIVKSSGEKILDCEIFCSILNQNFLLNPQTILEIGIALLHDKPIGLLVMTGTEVSEHLKKIAFGIEYFAKDTPQEMHDATKRLLRKAPK